MYTLKIHEAKTELEREIENSIIIAGDFNAPISIMARTSRKTATRTQKS